MLTTDRREATAQTLNTLQPVNALQPPIQWANPTAGAAAWTDPLSAGTASCPEDCHYCSGPETD